MTAAMTLPDLEEPVTPPHPTRPQTAHALMLQHRDGILDNRQYRHALAALMWDTRTRRDWPAYRTTGEYYRYARAHYPLQAKPVTRAGHLTRDAHELTAWYARQLGFTINATERVTPRPTRTPQQARTLDYHVAHLPVRLPDPPAPERTRQQLTMRDVLWRVIVLQLARKITDGEWQPIPPPNRTFNTPTGRDRGHPDHGEIIITAGNTVMTPTHVITVGCHRAVTSSQYKTAFFNLDARHKETLRAYWRAGNMTEDAFAAWEALAQLLLLGVGVLTERPRLPSERPQPSEPQPEEALVPLEELPPAHAYQGRPRRRRPT